MKNNIKVITKMFRFTKNCRLYYIFGVILFTSQIFTQNLVQSLFLKWLTQGVIDKSQKEVVVAIVSYLIISLIQIILTLLGISLYNISNIRIEKNLKLDLFRKQINQPMIYTNVRDSTDALNKLNVDADKSLQCLQNKFSQVVFSLFTIIGSLIVVFSIDWRIGALELIIGFLSLIMHTKYTKPMKSVSERILEATENSNKTLINILNGNETIRINNYNKSIHDTYNKSLSNVFNLSQIKIVLLTYQNAIKSVFGCLSLTGVFVLGVYFVYQKSLEFSSLIMLPTLCVGITEAMSNIIREYNNLQEPISAAERVLGLIDAEDNRSDGNIVLEEIKDDLFIKNLSFKYKERQILSNVNLHIKRGQSLAIVGKSGCGKSTLAKIILGFYNTDKETIFIDNYPIEKVKKESWKKQFAYVDQDCKLFNLSIFENIKLGNPEATDEDVYSAARLAGCDKFINKIEGKYDAVVSFGGKDLSGGEKQRICLARAIVRNANIMVLDEITSALDTETEQHIIDTIFELAKAKTIIIITHNMDIANRAEQIYTIDEKMLR